MQTKTKIALAAGLAGILALSGVAAADQGWGGKWMKHGMGHGGGMGPMGGLMERYDANKDGKLSQEEIDSNRSATHGEFDGDKNGTLALEEFKNLWLKARNQEMVREFQMFDADGNGQVTLDEYKGPLAAIVANRDRNGDGVLSREDRGGEGRGKGRRHGMGQGPCMPGADGDQPPPPSQN